MKQCFALTTVKLKHPSVRFQLFIALLRLEQEQKLIRA
jgi:hypothetical protein